MIKQFSDNYGWRNWPDAEKTGITNSNERKVAKMKKNDRSMNIING